MTKAEVRKTFLRKRLELTDNELTLLNQKLNDHFFSILDPSFVSNLHLFLSLEKLKEPDTWQIIDRLKKEFPNIRLIIPKVNESLSLDHFYFEGPHQLKPNLWGIPEPIQGIPADIAKIDMVIVPLLAVDRTGSRIGYGKGYYDIFLANCREDCKKVGLSFFEPQEFLFETEPHDIPLTCCVTPTGVRMF